MSEEETEVLDFTVTIAGLEREARNSGDPKLKSLVINWLEPLLRAMCGTLEELTEVSDEHDDTLGEALTRVDEVSTVCRSIATAGGLLAIIQPAVNICVEIIEKHVGSTALQESAGELLTQLRPYLGAVAAPTPVTAESATLPSPVTSSAAATQ